MKPVIITMTAFFKNGTNLQESLKVDSEDEFKKITKIADLISTNYKEPEDFHLSVSFNGLIIRVDETIAIKFDIKEDLNEVIDNDWS